MTSTPTLALDPWIAILEHAIPKDENGVIVRLSQPDDDEVELGVLPLGGVHPADLLDGLDAPAEWTALGVVCRGWASPMDGERPSRHPKRRRVLATVLLDRAGNWAGRTITESGEVVVDHPPTDGEIPRLLRAALGLDLRDAC
jgi:hypothetical protein